MAIGKEINPKQKAVQIIEKLSEEKAAAAMQILEIIAGASEETENIMRHIASKAFEASCEEVELTPEEKECLDQGKAEIEAGLKVRAEDVWKELDI
ncbi:MAG: hypothetical protein KBA08_04625 [Firmicutes bacterium]|nr:hypothetical protein [Bacillota bacterium]